MVLAAAEPPRSSLEAFERAQACPAVEHGLQIDRDLRTWNVSAGLGHPVPRALLDRLFRSQPCLLRVLVYRRRAHLRPSALPCVNGLENAAPHVGRLLQLLLASGVEVPDVEFLFNVRDRPVATLQEPAPIFSTWTTAAHTDVPFPDPRRLDEAADGCRAINGASPPRFKDRLPRLLFRGALSGGTADAPMRADSFQLLARARLALLAEKHPELIDAGLTLGNPEAGIPPELKQDPAFIAFWRRHRKPRMPTQEWTRYRFHAVIDGVSGASRLACALLSGSVVFKQTSPFYSWFERWLEPSVHFVPVAHDLSDLPRLVAAAREEGADGVAGAERLRGVPRAAGERLRPLFTPAGMVCYLARLLIVYRSVLGFTPGPPGESEGWRLLADASAASAASVGAGGPQQLAQPAVSATRDPKGVTRATVEGASRPAQQTPPATESAGASGAVVGGVAAEAAVGAFAESPLAVKTGYRREANECTHLLHSNLTGPALRCYTKRHAQSRAPGGEGLGDFETTWLKLRHDTEMLEFLGDARMPPECHGAPTVFRRILDAAEGSYRQRPAQSFKIFIPEGPDRQIWRSTHNRNVYTPPAADAQPPAILNPDLDTGRLEAVYFTRAANVSAGAECTGEGSDGGAAGGWVVVDDVFAQETLAALRAYLTESTFYYHAKFGGHYLSSLLEDGMSAPLLGRIVAELRARFPRLLGPHALRMAWAFKFDNALRGGVADGGDGAADGAAGGADVAGADVAGAPGRQLGVGVHADAAAVNLNFWPMEAGVADEGGLVLYKVGAPAGMLFEKFNNPKHLKRISEGASRETIAYKANRMVIFNSNLLHETSQLRFGPGYLRRRINLTLLFGRRCGR